jgi:hypothetical protein
MTTRKTTACVLCTAASALLFAAAPRAAGQVAPPPPPPAETDEAIVLSPFVVDATEDKGSYQATATLAGTRLRTELKDVGSSISVITSQFLQDTGAKSSEDLLVYTGNTEVGGVRGNFTGTGNGQQLNESSKLLKPNANTRVRGLDAADNTRDFFLTDIPWDGYNVGRIDIQRGPNAILFGMGSPAGIINASVDQAGFTDSNKVEARFDNEGSIRGSVNLNKVLLPGELAIRLAALSDRTKYRQKPAFNDDDRLYGAVRYDPLFLKKNGMTTSFRANFEHGSIDSNRPRSLTPGDQITSWFTDLNQAVYDPVEAWDGSTGIRKTTSPNFNPLVGDYGLVYGNVLSIYNMGSSTQNQFRTIESNTNTFGIASNGTIDGGIAGVPFARQVGVPSYASYMTTYATLYPDSIEAAYSGIGAYKDKRLSDANVGLFDYYNQLLDGDNKHEWRSFESFNFALSQTFFNNRAGIEGVYDSQSYNDGQVNGVTQTLFIDMNSAYIDGAANPNVGQAFVQSDNSGSENSTERTAKRATAFAEFRATDVFDRGLLTQILGRHTFTGMYADEKREATNLTFRRYAMTDDFTKSVYGTTTDYKKISDNERQVTVISYLSGDLRGTSLARTSLGNVGTIQKPQYTGSIYRFDSNWNSTVDPSASWTPGLHQAGTTQADNPANYQGWGTYAVDRFWSYDDGDKDQLYDSGNRNSYRIKSQAYIWQGYMFNDVLVPTVGWRRDQVSTVNGTADENSSGQVIKDSWTTQNYNSAGESISYSAVLHSPGFIRNRLPWGTDISLFYNRSKNFQPDPGKVDMFGEQLADPIGHTKDYGFTVSTLNERLGFKVNWFESNVKNARLSGFAFWRVAQWASVLAMDAVRIKEKDPANTWKWDATQGTGNQAEFDAGSAAVFEAYASNAAFRKFMDNWSLADNLQSEQSASADVPNGISATTDAHSQGIEFELSARPTPDWNVSINVSKTHAQQNNIGGALKEWIEAVEPMATGAAGDMRVWWAGDTSTMETLWNQNVSSQYALLKALEETDVAELRPWRFNVVTGYNFSRGPLKGVNVGASYRWEGREVVGFPVKSQTNADTGLTEYVYNTSRPYYGPIEDHIDLWLGYGRKLTRKIDWRIQLNIRDAFANKKLIPVSVEPDGTVAAYRIPELTSWQITNTFTF